ncbi:hypothetical protein LOTGIDRAFT_238905 [Lottia gigantea]|uniref:CUB domain-containing protein n=1 Tax=Lottia gigantea TaxID=225164 RepID=V4AZI1_LOTGI|nr:hypothetical protein LOTGIDRAFT_238905 [Lottia gigantea]ESO99136.1 hypothetical protein LOTGIDRAFT_238905 [Lottia gigantea]
MNGLYCIFLWALLSYGYGERYLKCKETYKMDKELIYDNEAVILNLPDTRTEDKINQNCHWRIGNGSFRIIFEEFNMFDSVNCNLESLQIEFPDYNPTKSMTFCGTSYPKELQLHYTDYINIVYSWLKPSKKPVRIIIRKTDQHTPEIRKLNVSATPMYMYSPGYPDKYYKDLDVDWMLTANDPKKRIMLEFLMLNLEDNVQCQNDFIQVKGDNTNFLTCGHKSKHVVALNDSRVNVTFKTNSFEENDGFVFRYYTEPYPGEFPSYFQFISILSSHLYCFHTPCDSNYSKQ